MGLDLRLAGLFDLDALTKVFVKVDKARVLERTSGGVFPSEDTVIPRSNACQSKPSVLVGAGNFVKIIPFRVLRNQNDLSPGICPVGSDSNRPVQRPPRLR